MSYCRHGMGSDVYVWSNGDMFHVWVYHKYSVGGEPKYRLQCATLRDLLGILTDLDETHEDFGGYRISEEAYSRIEKELAEGKAEQRPPD